MRNAMPPAAGPPARPAAGSPDRAVAGSPGHPGEGPPERRRLTGTLTGRAVLAGCLVALVSVLATAAVAVPLANRAARAQAAAALTAEADLLAAAVRTRPDALAAARRAEPVLHRQSIQLWLIDDGVPERAGLPEPIVTRLRLGQPVTDRGAWVAGRLAMVEGRPLGNGDALVLTRPFTVGLGAAVVSRLWLPLLVGLVVGGLLGSLLARQLSRPLRRAADAAARLRAGDRRVTVPVGPPAEVAALASALNELTRALAVSEARQREFLLSVSHELRTPLTTLKGYAEALTDRMVDGPEAGRVMLVEAEQLDRLISDLLALARLEADDFPVQFAPVDLATVVSAAAEAWEPRFTSAGLVWRCELPPTGQAVAVTTDGERVRQVIDGLLGNALRVVPAGAPVVLALAPADGVVEIEVRDGGPGLSDDDLAVAFQRGRLAARYQGVRPVGSGLGLALAARLVARLGGTIVAGHAPEGGARFTVRLPARPYKTRTLA
ncbi:MAG: HAMP domain-containing histidine kinase [Micromonosporaceae bacterium]|nr:HAMP domain-containing histidine kinase [Micromonosporaceae bacterium]